MNILIISFFFSLGSILFFLWLPGIFCSLWLLQEKTINISASFFFGWVFNALLACLIIPFVTSTASLAFSLRSALILFMLASILFWTRQQRFSWQMERFKSSFSASFSTVRILISLFILFLFSSFVATHNLGFDDTSNLTYLYRVTSGTPFQSFVNLAKRFSIEAANYPFFGVIHGTLAYGIKGGILFIYYIAGFLVLNSFLLASYDYFAKNESGKYQALGSLAVVAIALTIFGWDNYFNYGIYPLQQSKILFLAGLLFLLWDRKEGQTISPYFWLGAALCAAAVLNHLNLVILYFIAISVYILLFILLNKNCDRKIKRCCIILLFPLLATPSAITPNKGFIRINHESISPLKTETGHSKQEKSINKIKEQAAAPNPTTEKFKTEKKTVANGTGFTHLSPLQRAEKFYKKFRRLTFFVKRSLTPEIIIIFFIFLFPNILFYFPVINGISILIAMLVLGYSYLTVIPKQALIAFYQSSTLFMLYDLSMTNTEWDNSTRYWSDPYTAFYMQTVYNLDCHPLDAVPELLAFSPLFKPEAIHMAASMVQSEPDDKWILNSRYWGLPALKRYNNNQQKKNDTLAVRFDGSRNDLYTLRSIANELFTILTQKIYTPFVITGVTNINKNNQSNCWSKYLEYPELPVNTYHDAAILQIPGDPQHSYQLNFKFHGGWVRILSYCPSEEIIEEPLLVKGNNKNKKWDKSLAGKSTYHATSSAEVEKVYILTRTHGPGYVGGLGQMKSVDIKKINK